MESNTNDYIRWWKTSVILCWSSLEAAIWRNSMSSFLTWQIFQCCYPSMATLESSSTLTISSPLPGTQKSIQFPDMPCQEEFRELCLTDFTSVLTFKHLWKRLAPKALNMYTVSVSVLSHHDWYVGGRHLWKRYEATYKILSSQTTRLSYLCSQEWSPKSRFMVEPGRETTASGHWTLSFTSVIQN